MTLRHASNDLGNNSMDWTHSTVGGLLLKASAIIIIIYEFQDHCGIQTTLMRLTIVFNDLRQRVKQ